MVFLKIYLYCNPARVKPKGQAHSGRGHVGHSRKQWDSGLFETDSGRIDLVCSGVRKWCFHPHGLKGSKMVHNLGEHSFANHKLE